ncbi:MAG: preprotein translocase subunit SecA [Spirochaetes bacterium]|nr:preprotein translocase subunit SecA [Spirochaetota bacterium]
MIDKIFSIFFGTKHDRDVKRLRPHVEKINGLEPEFKALDNEQLKSKSFELRERVQKGETLDDVLPEAFALVRESSYRVLGMRHFDVQLMGGIVLHQGKIAEMKTGEGKTLVATLAVYLNALSGKGVHVVTVNDYLARRDAEWMGAVYKFLGFTVGIIQANMDHGERQHAYGCDITYGTNNEFGFDYLRDNMVPHRSLKVQREMNFAIVDEVDSILIDEARTPLIISGSVEDSTKRYFLIDKIVPSLIRDTDYEVNEKERTVLLTEEGVHHIEKLLKIDNLYDNTNIEIVHFVNQALKAHMLFERDVDYIVKDGQVIIVDEFTGRLMPGRRFSDGLHQALEAKERVQIARESQTLASITFQNFFRMYEKLSGMTGTADTEALEFNSIYKLDVVVVPTNQPVLRKDFPDKIYKTEREKFNAIADDIAERIRNGQPSLVGTISIEKSETLSQMLKSRGISHNVLNAKYHEREAEIVAEAGRPGMVTIATNMAGRGTDIVLGGKRTYTDDLDHYTVIHDQHKWDLFKVAILNNNFMEAEKLSSEMQGQDQHKSAEILKAASVWHERHVVVKEAGGLYILGTERHEARRIDNQLRGRSGRQGDPGASRFYLSLEDNLMRIFGSERIHAIMDRLGMEEGQEIESKMVSKAIAGAQKRVEGRNYEIRKHLLEYDDVMNSQREYIYGRRNEILEGDDISDTINDYFDEIIHSAIDLYSNDKKNASDWDMEGLVHFCRSRYHYILDIPTSDLAKMAHDDMAEHILNGLMKKYREKAAEVGEDNIRELERMISLQVIDSKWRDHLYQMDELRDGIWTSSYAERNPLVEYKIKGFDMFQNLMENLKSEIIEFLMKVEIKTVEKAAPADYVPAGQEQHHELNQFQSGGGVAAASSVSGPGKKKKEQKPVVGGVQRKKSKHRR